MSHPAMIDKLKRYLPGELLTQENEISRKLFIIKSGKVSVFKTHMGQRVVLSTLGEGEIFGELSFIEATPRSASVEALTVVDAHVIEVEDVSSQIEKLPDWILPIFKTVFARLRAADQKIIVLHGMSGFERKHYGTDSLTQKTYRELLRANRLLKLAYSDALQAGKPLRESDIPELFTEVLGDLALNIPLWLRILKDQGFIERDEFVKNKRIVLRAQAHEAWIWDLQREISLERFLRLSDGALGVLKELYRFIQHQVGLDKNSEIEVEISLADIGWAFASFGEEAIAELKSFNAIVATKPGYISFTPAMINRLYANQMILRFYAPDVRANAG